MAKTKKTKEVTEIEPTTVKGSHLTVITDNFGKTTLIWDDEALARDVREAIASYEATVQKVVEITEEKVKKTRKKKTT